MLWLHSGIQDQCNFLYVLNPLIIHKINETKLPLFKFKNEQTNKQTNTFISNITFDIN